MNAREQCRLIKTTISGDPLTRQTLIKLTLSMGLALTVLSTAGHAMGSKASLKNQNVALGCTGAGNAALHKALCAELRSQLSATYPSCQFTQSSSDARALDMTLTILTASSTAVTAKLAWAGAAKGSGEPLTVGARDVSLGQIQYGMLIKSLLKTTKLPLSTC